MSTNRPAVGSTRTVQIAQGSLADSSQKTTTQYNFECDDEGCAWEEVSSTETTVSVTSGVKFSMEDLARATLSGSQLPARICTSDVGEPLCEPTTVSSISANWVGTGEISRDVNISHLGPLAPPDKVYNSHQISFLRDATATGSFAGQDLGTADQAFLGRYRIGDVCANCSS